MVYLYLHEWLILMVNVGKYTSPMDGRWIFKQGHALVNCYGVSTCAIGGLFFWHGRQRTWSANFSQFHFEVCVFWQAVAPDPSI